MTTKEIGEFVIYLIVLTSLAPLLGNYMYRVFSGEKHFLQPVLGWAEKLIYRFIGIDAGKESNWKSYLFGLMIFNFLGIVFLFVMQVVQQKLPLNPASQANAGWHSALNTAVSFVTNTNWQSYAGEVTLGYFVQMIGLTVQNFLSAATGIAVLLALIRGIARKKTENIGNFWVDLTRTILYVLLPLSLILAVVLISQGVIQNFNHYEVVQTLQGNQQIIPQGPVASQLSIKQIGTNGGGFFNTNSAHPFENPTPFSNFLEMLAILLIPASLTFTYGKMVGSDRHGRLIYLVMLFLFISGFVITAFAEYSNNLIFEGQRLMEGKETRFGILNSVLWTVSTTAASNGSVNAMIDSMSPLSGLVAIFNIMLGEVIFGGVGSGLYGLVIFIILTVFIAGLMVGRSPEYLGKKIEAFEVQMAIIGLLAPGFVILVFSAWASVSGPGLNGLNNTGPHGFSEILYAYSSAAGNNGSAFAGLGANTLFYNLTTGFGMLAGRYGVIIPVLAIAGNMARKNTTPASPGTFRTDNLLFACLLISVILIIGGLTFFPALSLGPVVEHILMKMGVTF
jgi:potassium-transporting ATPase potassium-binding subunit